MANDPGEEWAAWLRDRFDRHPTIKTNADLVRAGGLKPNGRPVIDASSVTQWLRGRRPSFELAGVTASAFGVPRSAGWRAAGYGGVDVFGPTEGDLVREYVGGDSKDAVEQPELLLYRRPEGISDAEWERVKTESRGFIEWQIEKASRER